MTSRRRWSDYHAERFNGHEDGEAGLLSGASPAALQPARRLSWLASERALLCLSLPTQSGLVRCPIACVHASVPAASWGGIPENFGFLAWRTISRPCSQADYYRPTGRRMCSILVRTDEVQLAYPSPMGGVVSWRSLPHFVA